MHRYARTRNRSSGHKCSQYRNRIHKRKYTTTLCRSNVCKRHIRNNASRHRIHSTPNRLVLSSMHKSILILDKKNGKKKENKTFRPSQAAMPLDLHALAY